VEEDKRRVMRRFLGRGNAMTIKLAYQLLLILAAAMCLGSFFEPLRKIAWLNLAILGIAAALFVQSCTG
jgi:hypothetical protein